MVKRAKRSQEDQYYRDNLAYDLKELRAQGDAGRDLAIIFLDEEKKRWGYEDRTTPHIRENEKLNELMREELAKGNFDYIVENSTLFPNLDSETANMLYETGHGERVRDNINRFYVLDVRVFDKIIYPHIINKPESRSSNVLNHYVFDGFCERNIKRFENQSDIIIYLIDHGVPPEEINLNNFYGLNKAAAKKIGYKYLLSQKNGSNEFRRLDEESLREMLNEVTPQNVRNLKNIMPCFVLDKNVFHCIRDKYLECKKNGWSTDVEEFKNAIIRNIGLFKGLTSEEAELLIKNNHKDIVVNQPELFGLKKDK